MEATFVGTTRSLYISVFINVLGANHIEIELRNVMSLEIADMQIECVNHKPLPPYLRQETACELR
jgi:hypothetical protein